MPPKPANMSRFTILLARGIISHYINISIWGFLFICDQEGKTK